MLAIIGASGSIGGSTLDALLSYQLMPANEIVAFTTSSPDSETWKKLEAKKVNVRHATFDDAESLEKALKGCEKFFLVSTPHTELDYEDAEPGSGRDQQHIVAINAARRAGVRHLYYTSLAFGSPSKAGVMQAHVRTEAFLRSLHDITTTVLREGLYNESWPLYLGYYDPKADDRDVVTVAGDGKISWTAIEDLGLASAVILSAPGDSYAGKTLYLSAGPKYAKTVAELAELVSQARGKSVKTNEVSREEYEAHYIDQRKMGGPGVRWWSSTYSALKDGECLIQDSPLEELLQSKGKTPKSLSETIKEMVGA